MSEPFAKLDKNLIFLVSEDLKETNFFLHKKNRFPGLQGALQSDLKTYQKKSSH